MTGVRVLFLDHAGVLGGAELSLLDIAQRYSKLGAVVLMTDGPFRARLEGLGIATHLVPLGAAARLVRKESIAPSPSALVGVLRAARRVAQLSRDFDLLYANSQKAFVVAAIAGVLARRPVLWHLRDILDRDHFSQLNVLTVVTLANRIASRVIANSQATASAFAARGGHVAKIRVVYNGIDATAFRGVSESELVSTREQLGVGSACVVGVFGRLAPWKGQHVLLEALPMLPSVHALFVGDALFGEDIYAKTLRDRASELGVRQRAHFLGARSDIPLLMRLVDVVVHTSVRAEPFGRVIVEGMMAGRPVIASRAGGTTEIIQDGITGELVTPGDIHELATTIAGVLRTERGASISAAGCADAKARFGLESMLTAVTMQIEEVASQ